MRSATKTAARIVLSACSRSRNASATRERTKTITSVASDPSAWT